MAGIRGYAGEYPARGLHRRDDPEAPADILPQVASPGQREREKDRMRERERDKQKEGEKERERERESERERDRERATVMPPCNRLLVPRLLAIFFFGSNLCRPRLDIASGKSCWIGGKLKDYVEQAGQTGAIEVLDSLVFV